MKDLEELLVAAKDILSDWNLFVNEDKTEFTRFYLADMTEIDPKTGKSVRKGKTEEWRSNNSLGSLLCSLNDIKRRCQLGNAAFSSYNNCWLKGPNISLERKIRLYDALVASVMLYNTNSWSLPAGELNKLDTTHRRHLRNILKIHWPKGRISNRQLYKRCNTTKLSERVRKQRWTMLGHVLRSGTSTPAYLSLEFAIDNKFKGRRGAHQANLFNLILKDLSLRKFTLKNNLDLQKLRQTAFDRQLWRTLY